jgi:YVTN family beta-propeller protein
MLRQFVLTSLLVPAAFLSAAGVPAEKPLLLVANQKDHTISLIDPATNKQIDTIDVGGITGHEIAVSPDGRTAFVPLYGSSGVGKPGTDGQAFSVIDLPSRKIVHTIEFPHGVRPHLPRFDPTGKILFVSTELDQTITEIDPKTYKILGTVPTTQPLSHMFALSHDGKKAYTANVIPGTVSVIDLPAKRVLTVIPISGNTQRISISNDDTMIFTADQTKPQLAVIDTATNAIKTWIPLPGNAYGTAPTKDGKFLLVSLNKLKKVAVVDLKTLQIVRTVDMPGEPQEILVRPDGKTAYASCLTAVAAIDLANWSVTPIEAGHYADGLAWAR